MGLPPTSVKGPLDTNPVTTFETIYTGAGVSVSHSGVNATVTIPGNATNYGSALYQGSVENGSASVYWSTSSSSTTDFTATGTPALTQQFNSGMGTVTIASGPLPGITISSAPKTGTVKITALVPSGYLGVANTVCTYSLTDGANTVISAASIGTGGIAVSVQPTIIGYYSVTSGSSYTFKIRGGVSGGTLYIGSFGGEPYILSFLVEYVA